MNTGREVSREGRLFSAMSSPGKMALKNQRIPDIDEKAVLSFDKTIFNSSCANKIM